MIERLSDEEIRKIEKEIEKAASSDSDKVDWDYIESLEQILREQYEGEICGFADEYW